jgi:hypothetical protein
MAAGSGNRDRQGADRGRLVDDYEDPAVAGEFVEHLPQPGFGVDQRCVVQPFPARVEGDGVVAVLTDVEAEENLVVAVHIASPRRRLLARSPVRHRLSAATLRGDLPQNARRSCPYQRSVDATRPGDNTPRIIRTTGAVSHARPGDRAVPGRGRPKR